MLFSTRAALLGLSLLGFVQGYVNTTGLICQYGCWDEEDEACHGGLNDAWMH